MLKQIDLLRHGEPVGGRKYRGQIDDPLSDAGWAEIRRVVEGRDEWDAIVHSPLIRCSDFAAELSASLNIPKMVDDRFKEVGFGAWEGLTRADICAKDSDALQRFYQDPVNNQPDGAERLRAFYLRVGDAWDELVENNEHERVLLIAHAGVMRAIIAQVLKAPLLSMYRMQIPSAGMISINFSEQRPPTVQF